jgi:hypothetical protein
MVRVDSTSVESEALKLMMTLEGAKLASVCPSKSQYTCLKAEELKVSSLKVIWDLRFSQH